MRAVFSLAWHRFNVVASIFGDAQGRVIVTTFYFTILAPFGLISRLTSDPLKLKSNGTTAWIEREPVPDDLESAQQQG